MSGTDRPLADIITTIARRSLTGSFAVRLIRCSRRPSSKLTGRTNTSGRRPTATPMTTTWRQVAASETTDQLPSPPIEMSQ
ncbi:hypothetical protein [Streptomyces sp. NBC_00391]|uniref:hypothetical protein n=2 Tax=Streptomyces TaxID=1883 RepID=UPI002E1E228F